jgi:hypothetical protein
MLIGYDKMTEANISEERYWRYRLCSSNALRDPKLGQVKGEDDFFVADNTFAKKTRRKSRE